MSGNNRSEAKKAAKAILDDYRDEHDHEDINISHVKKYLDDYGKLNGIQVVQYQPDLHADAVRDFIKALGNSSTLRDGYVKEEFLAHDIKFLKLIFRGGNDQRILRNHKLVPDALQIKFLESLSNIEHKAILEQFISNVLPDNNGRPDNVNAVSDSAKVGLILEIWKEYPNRSLIAIYNAVIKKVKHTFWYRPEFQTSYSGKIKEKKILLFTTLVPYSGNEPLDSIQIEDNSIDSKIPEHPFKFVVLGAIGLHTHLSNDTYTMHQALVQASTKALMNTVKKYNTRDPNTNVIGRDNLRALHVQEVESDESVPLFYPEIKFNIYEPNRRNSDDENDHKVDVELERRDLEKGLDDLMYMYTYTSHSDVSHSERPQRNDPTKLTIDDFIGDRDRVLTDRQYRKKIDAIQTSINNSSNSSNQLPQRYDLETLDDHPNYTRIKPSECFELTFITRRKNSESNNIHPLLRDLRKLKLGRYMMAYAIYTGFKYSGRKQMILNLGLDEDNNPNEKMKKLCRNLNATPIFSLIQSNRISELVTNLTTLETSLAAHPKLDDIQSQIQSIIHTLKSLHRFQACTGNPDANYPQRLVLVDFTTFPEINDSDITYYNPLKSLPFVKPNAAVVSHENINLLKWLQHSVLGYDRNLSGVGYTASQLIDPRSKYKIYTTLNSRGQIKIKRDIPDTIRDKMLNEWIDSIAAELKIPSTDVKYTNELLENTHIIDNSKNPNQPDRYQEANKLLGDEKARKRILRRNRAGFNNSYATNFAYQQSKWHFVPNNQNN